MKRASTECKAFLAANNIGHLADLLTIVTRSGTTYRWASTSQAITVGAYTWLPAGDDAPGFSRSRLSQAVGLVVDTLDLTIYGPGWIDSDGVYNTDGDGTSCGASTIVGYFDGASIELDRAIFAAPAEEPYIIDKWFYGTISIAEPSGVDIQIRCKSKLADLSRSLPTTLLQPQCNHTIYDDGCSLSPGALSVSGIVGYAASKTIIYSDSAALLAKATGYFDHGTLYVAETKETAPIAPSGFVVAGGWAITTLSKPLALDAEIGHTITLLPGCDKSKARCEALSNLAHYRGFPHVPRAGTGSV